jgi:hypothetical protein
MFEMKEDLVEYLASGRELTDCRLAQAETSTGLSVKVEGLGLVTHR